MPIYIFNYIEQLFASFLVFNYGTCACVFYSTSGGRCLVCGCIPCSSGPDTRCLQLHIPELTSAASLLDPLTWGWLLNFHSNNTHLSRAPVRGECANIPGFNDTGCGSIIPISPTASIHAYMVRSRVPLDCLTTSLRLTTGHHYKHIVQQAHSLPQAAHKTSGVFRSLCFIGSKGQFSLIVRVYGSVRPDMMGLRPTGLFGQIGRIYITVRPDRPWRCNTSITFGDTKRLC